MKDPLDKNERAYEILEVPEHAGPNEINAAYARLTAQRPDRRPALTNAWQRLRRPDTRFEEDFWYYSVDDKAEGPGPRATDAQVRVPWDPVLPARALELGLEFTDLSDGGYMKDFTQIEFREIKLSYTHRYDEEAGVGLDVVIDK